MNIVGKCCVFKLKSMHLTLIAGLGPDSVSGALLVCLGSVKPGLLCCRHCQLTSILDLSIAVCCF